VIAGELRGRRVVVPRTGDVRPTYDRVRESVFGIIDPLLDGARVLDLFAGSGVLGIEALSRGAASATFVERDARVAGVLGGNVERLGLEGRSRIVRGDAVRLLETAIPGGPFDVVFVDPPYAGGLAEDALALLGNWPGLATHARVIVEHGGARGLGDSYGRLVRHRAKTYGDTMVDFYECTDGEPLSRGNE
jgi:16S rRNA (guanine966-N2)-methyltransferase